MTRTSAHPGGMSDQPFDAAQDLRDAPRASGARQRPKDAATLILTPTPDGAVAIVADRVR